MVMMKTREWTEEELERYKVHFPYRSHGFYSSANDPSRCQESVSVGGRSEALHQCSRKPLPGLEICGTHKAAVDRRLVEIETSRVRAEESKRQQAEDKAKEVELNLRVEGFTGEPSHLMVDRGWVVGLDVVDLEAILRRAEDKVLGL